MRSDLNIDRAKPDDAEALAAILTDWIRETPWMPELHGKAPTIGFLGMLIRETEVLVAQQDGIPCGFLALQGQQIPALYLAAAARGRGIGRELLDAAKDQSPNLSLWTFQANARARKFYMREGFREVELTDGARNEEKLPDVRCVWQKPEVARG